MFQMCCIKVNVSYCSVTEMVQKSHIDKVCDVCTLVSTVIKSDLPRGSVSQLPVIIQLVTQVIDRCLLVID